MVSCGTAIDYGNVVLLRKRAATFLIAAGDSTNYDVGMVPGRKNDDCRRDARSAEYAKAEGRCMLFACGWVKDLDTSC